MSQPFEIEVVGSAREEGVLTDLYVRVGMNRIGPLSESSSRLSLRTYRSAT